MVVLAMGVVKKAKRRVSGLRESTWESLLTHASLLNELLRQVLHGEAHCASIDLCSKVQLGCLNRGLVSDPQEHRVALPSATSL